MTFLCRRWKTSWWRCAGCSVSSFPSRLSQCPRSPLPVTLTGAVCVLLSRRLNIWWKCRRSYPTHRYAGLWSRTWIFQFLVVVVVSVSVYTQDRVQQRLVEQNFFPQRLQRKTSTFQFLVVAEIFLLHRRLPACRVRQINGFFALFPEGKSATLGPHSGSELPGHQLIHASGSAGGFLHGCSWCVDAVSRWLVETSGLGPRSLAAWVKAGTGPSSCVSLRVLLEAFPVICARAVRTWNLVHYFRVPVSGSRFSGLLGVAYGCENWIFREMTSFVVAMLGTTVDTCSASVLWRLWMNFAHFLRGGGLDS